MSGGELSVAVRSTPAGAAVLGALGDAENAWVVGGALRDAALGRDVVDLDIAVTGGEEEAVRAIARESGGTAFPLSEEFGAWRATSPRGWHVDVSRLRSGSIEADLVLRDFTINAMGLSLAEVARGSDAGLMDPVGGREDLGARRLRVAAKAAFGDDPLRLLRAARIAAELGLAIDEATAALARHAASRAASTGSSFRCRSASARGA